MSQDNDLKPETLAAQALHFLDAETGAVVPPLHPSTTFARDADYAPRGASTYSRYGGPAVDQVEALLARLEGGAGALVFASGLAASAAVVMALKPGDRFVCHAHIYWGFREWLEDFCPRFGLDLRLIDMTDAAQLDAALEGGAALVWTETPSNPLWEVIDIAAVAEKAAATRKRLRELKCRIPRSSAGTNRIRFKGFPSTRVSGRNAAPQVSAKYKACIRLTLMVIGKRLEDNCRRNYGGGE